MILLIFLYFPFLNHLFLPPVLDSSSFSFYILEKTDAFLSQYILHSFVQYYYVHFLFPFFNLRLHLNLLLWETSQEGKMVKTLDVLSLPPAQR